MTAEQLEELLAEWEAGSECEGLQNLAPSLARRVIAAEELAEELEYEEGWQGLSPALRAALTAYREASK